MILVYDYLLTLPRETFLIWPTPWNATKILFLITRYLPFVDVALYMHDIRMRNASADTCLVIHRARSWLVWFGLSLPEAILSLRTWATWDRDRRLAIGLLIFFAMIWIPSIALATTVIKAVEFVALSGLPNSSGCVPVAHHSDIARICWILLLTYDAGLCLLMLIRAVKWFKDGCVSEFALTVFRNGLLYYLVLLTMTFANVFLGLSWQYNFTLTQRFIHTIIACRVILDIRGQALKEDLSIANSCMVDTTLDISTTFAVDMDYHDEVIYRTTVTGKRGKARVVSGDGKSDTAAEYSDNFLILD